MLAIKYYKKEGALSKIWKIKEGLI